MSHENPIDPEHSENNFGLFTSDGKAKFAIWKFIDNQKLSGLSRGKPNTKTSKGMKMNSFHPY